MTTRRQLFAGAAALGAYSMLGAHAFAQDVGSVVRFAIAASTGVLDPHVYTGAWGALDLIFEPLVAYGQDGALIPALAESWVIENDGKLLRLNLRKGVTFHDGAPWDAEAAKWNFERWTADEGNDWMNFSRLLETMTVVDSHTFEMAFKEPPLGLMFEISYARPCRFLSPKSVAADGTFGAPVGTGPFKEVERTDAQSVFERHEGYWGTAPAFDRLEMKVLPDSRGRMAALRAGEIDVIGGTLLSPIKANEAQALIDAGVKVDVLSGVTMLLAFNPDRTVALADANVRKAISLGFDREGISKALYGGFARPAGSMFPASTPLTGEPFPADVRDVVEAGKLLDAAGWIGTPFRKKNGTTLSLEIVISEEQIVGSRSMAEVLQAQLAEIGIEIVIRTTDHASRHSDIPARKYDMTIFTTYGAPYDPYGSMVAYLLSTFANGIDGTLVTDVAHLDPLVTDAINAPADKAEETLKAVFEWVRKETAFAPILVAPVFWARGERIKDFTPPPTDYDTPYEGLTLVSQ